MRISILSSKILRKFNPFSNHYNRVVSTNTNGTDSIAQHGSITQVSASRHTGSVYANGHVYFIMDGNRRISKINVDTKVVTSPIYIPALPDRAYSSGVLAPNGKIYCVPKDAPDILVIDPADDSYYFITGIPAGTLKWQCGTVNDTGILYCIPRNNTNILKIDTNDDTFSLLPHTAGSWFSSTLTRDGIIYALPFSDANILKIDTNDDTVSEFASIAGTTKWAGAVLIGQYIYGIPYRSSAVLKIDISDDSISTFGSFGTSNDKWFDGALLENGFIYGCPSSSGLIIKIDPATDTATTFTGLSGSQQWRGISNGGQGSLFAGPSFGRSTVLEITNDGVTEFLDEEFIKSAYYNKL